MTARQKRRLLMSTRVLNVPPCWVERSRDVVVSQCASECAQLVLEADVRGFVQVFNHAASSLDACAAFLVQARALRRYMSVILGDQIQTVPASMLRAIRRHPARTPHMPWLRLKGVQRVRDELKDQLLLRASCGFYFMTAPLRSAEREGAGFVCTESTQWTSDCLLQYLLRQGLRCRKLEQRDFQTVLHIDWYARPQRDSDGTLHETLHTASSVEARRSLRAHLEWRLMQLTAADGEAERTRDTMHDIVHFTIEDLRHVLRDMQLYHLGPTDIAYPPHSDDNPWCWRLKTTNWSELSFKMANFAVDNQLL